MSRMRDANERLFPRRLVKHPEFERQLKLRDVKARDDQRMRRTRDTPPRRATAWRGRTEEERDAEIVRISTASWSHCLTGVLREVPQRCLFATPALS